MTSGHVPTPRACLLSVVLLATVGCGGGMRTLSMAPEDPAYVDRSSVAPSLADGSFDRIMIVPPSGTAGVAFRENLAAIERSFIARDITVVSSAVTSRVLFDERTRDGRASEAGLQLSELERALLLARESNADAVLQIGSWRWIPPAESDYGTRYFVEGADGKSFVEVDRARYENEASDEDGRLVRSYDSDVLGFTGRLVDVDSGEVVASFLIDVPKVNVADPLIVTIDSDGEITDRSYSWTDPAKDRAMAGRAIGALFDRLADLISDAGT